LEKLDFLWKYIFVGLTNLNDGFDAQVIRYFSESDFRIVLERVEKLNITIHGIEPWKDESFFDVLTYEDFNSAETDSTWYWKAFQKFIDTGEQLKYAASYEVPENLLKGGN